MLQPAPTAIIALSFAFLPQSLYSQQPKDLTAGEAQARVRILVEGYLSNRSSFSFYTATVKISQGRNTSLRSAFLKGPDRNVAVGDAKIAFDDPNLVVVRESNDKPILDSVSGQASIGISSVAILGDGNSTLDVDMFAGAGMIKDNFRGIDFTTWNTGGAISDGTDGEFGAYAASHLKAGGTVELKGTVILDGVETTAFDLVHPTSRVECFVSEDRGFIPVEIRMVIKDKPFITAKTSDIRQCSNSRWFPMRSVVAWHSGDTEAGDHTIREVLITNLNVDNRPSKNRFVVELPAGLRLYNEGSQTSGFSLKQPATVSLDRINDLRKIGADTAARRAAVPPAGSSSSSVLVGSLLALSLIIFAAIVFSLARRKYSA